MKIYNLTKFLFSKVHLINYIKRQHEYYIVGVNINYFTHIYFMNMSLFSINFLFFKFFFQIFTTIRGDDCALGATTILSFTFPDFNSGKVY
jgi:hypothetical protein